MRAIPSRLVRSTVRWRTCCTPWAAPRSSLDLTGTKKDIPWLRAYWTTPYAPESSDAVPGVEIEQRQAFCGDECNLHRQRPGRACSNPAVNPCRATFHCRLWSVPRNVSCFAGASSIGRCSITSTKLCLQEQYTWQCTEWFNCRMVLLAMENHCE